MKIRYFLVLLAFFAMGTLNGQGIKWADSKEWKLYDIHDRHGFRYSVDTLKSFNYIKLNTEGINYFMASVSPIEANKQILWMGQYVATCVIDSMLERKILISTYGGFFYDQKTNGYYQVSPELRDQWYEFLNENNKKILKN